MSDSPIQIKGLKKTRKLFEISSKVGLHSLSAKKVKQKKIKAEAVVKNPQLNWTTIFLALVIGLLCVLSSVRLGFPELSHGDEWADGSVLIAGENFSRMGLLQSHLLPIFYPKSPDVPPAIRPDTPDYNVLTNFGTYTRIPGFFHWVNGFFQKFFFDYDSLIPFRVVILFFGIISVTVFFFLIIFITQSSRLAFLASLVYITNPYFLANFDSLHQNAFMDLFRNLAMLCAVVFAFSSQHSNAKVWWGGFIALFLLSLTAYEYLPWMTVILIGIGGILFFRNERLRALKTILLGTGIATGLILHFSLVAMHYGSLAEAVRDRLSNAAQRMMGHENLLGSAGSLDWGVWLDTVALKFPDQASVVGGGGLFVLVVLGFVLVLCLDSGGSKKLLIALGTGLFFVAAAFLWYVIMPIHCIEHSGLSFLQKFLIPGICLLLAIPFEAGYRLMETKGVQLAWRRVLVYLPVAGFAWVGVLQSELPVTASKIAFEREFLKVAECLKILRPMVKPPEFMACNLLRPTFMMMYYTQSRVAPVTSVLEFEKLPEPPKVFLFVPVNSPESQQLGQFLEKNYRVVSFCDNRRLPFYVMERL